MAARRGRLDAEMVRRGLAPSRTVAKEQILAGKVRVTGLGLPKPASLIAADQDIHVLDDTRRYASRGGLKLAGALDDLDVDPRGHLALDAGAAHGGFTDVLLRAGARAVIAVDVAYGQFDWQLRNDDRVTLLERTNVRHLTREDLQGRRPTLAVADLSFISLRKVLPALVTVADPTATLLPMVKPQFEAGAGSVGKGGVVRDPQTWTQVLHDVADTAADVGLALLGAAPSRYPGPAGNVEFFLHLRGGDTETPDPATVDAVIADAVRRGARLAGKPI